VSSAGGGGGGGGEGGSRGAAGGQAGSRLQLSRHCAEAAAEALLEQLEPAPLPLPQPWPLPALLSDHSRCLQALSALQLLLELRLSDCCDSAADAESGSLIVAAASGATAFAIDVKTGKSRPLGALANNASDPMCGIAFFPSDSATPGLYVVTQFGIWNSTKPGAAPSLVAPISGFSSAIVTSSAQLGSIFIADQEGTEVLRFDFKSRDVTALKGINRPMDLAISGSTLYQQQGYTLFSLPAAGGSSPKKVTSLPNGPGFPRVNGFSTDRVWW
jgi:hypothetical protein